MGIDFITPDEVSHGHQILKKLNSKRNNLFVWRKIIYYFSWLAILLISLFIAIKMFYSSGFLFLEYIDLVLYIFILADFVLINKICSSEGLESEKFWFWFLINLLILNFVWSLGMKEYASQGIYEFNIPLNYFVIAVSFLLLNNVRRNISKFLKYFKGIDWGIERENIKNAKRGKKIENEFYEKSFLIKSAAVMGNAARGGEKKKKNTIIALSLLLLIILAGGVLRFGNLGEEALYHDQLIQYSAVNGVIKHGQAAIFNPVTDELVRPYKRASLLTYVSAFLVKLFGNTEGVIKFPVALAGILLIPVFYYSAVKFVSPGFALFGSMLIAFNPYLVYLSRFFRDYSLKILFFTIAAILLADFIGKIQKNKFDRDSLKILTVSVPFLYLSYHFGSAETIFLSMLFLIFVLGIIILKSKKIITQNSITTLILWSVIAGAFLIAGANFFGYLSLDNIRYIINTHLAFDGRLLSGNGTEYQHYLFDYHFKDFVFVLLLIYGIFLLIKRKWKYVFIFVQLGLGYYIIVYLGKRYVDFRYISFLIPLVILSMVIGLQLFWRSLNAIQVRSLKKTVQLLFIIMLILIPTYFLPFRLPPANILSQFIALGQPWWQKDEGAVYIHRRAVAPEYKKAGSYLNNNADFNNDIFIFTASEYIYLNSIPNNSFYAPRNSAYIKLLADRNKKIHYQKFLSQNQCRDIWFVGTYVHLLNRELLNAFIKNPNAIIVGAEIGVMHFNYNDFYINRRELTWPTLIMIPSSCENMDIINSIE